MVSNVRDSDELGTEYDRQVEEVYACPDYGQTAVSVASVELLADVVEESFFSPAVEDITYQRCLIGSELFQGDALHPRLQGLVSDFFQDVWRVLCRVETTDPFLTEGGQGPPGGEILLQAFALGLVYEKCS